MQLYLLNLPRFIDPGSFWTNVDDVIPKNIEKPTISIFLVVAKSACFKNEIPTPQIIPVEQSTHSMIRVLTHRMIRVFKRLRGLSLTCSWNKPLSCWSRLLSFLIRFISRPNHCYWERNVCLNIKICKYLCSNEKSMSNFQPPEHNFSGWKFK